MHAYATPSSDEYEAQDGDFEFIIMDVQDDLITLKGKRNGNTMYMHRLNKPAEDYINDVLDIKEKMRSSKYAFVIDNDTIIVKRNLNVFTFTNPKDAKNIDIPFVTTATGFEFYDSVDIMGKNVTGFTYSEDGIWANPADKSVALVSLPLTLPEILMTNTWSIVASGMSETALKYFNVAKEGSAAEGETINYMIFGPNDITGLGSINGYSGAFGFTFTSGNYKGSLLIDAEELTDDIITFNFAYIGEGNGVWYYNNAKYNWIISALCGAKGATYTLTADDPKNPTYIKMQQIENPEIYFTVYNGLIAEPFDK